MKRKFAAICLLFLLIISFGYFLWLKTHSPIPLVISHIAMDTNFRIKILPKQGTDGEKVFEHAISEIDRIAKIAMPDTNSRILWKGQETVSMDEGLGLIYSALLWEERTRGAFSPALGALTSLWDIPNKGEYIPSDDSVEIALNITKGHKILSSDTLYKTQQLSFDLGGIAKGYALDMLFTVLDSARKQGLIEEFLIDAGRSITGYRESDSFVIGIQNPRVDSPFASFLLPPGYFCSSCGDYERYFILDGRRYHHILDPNTGYPAGKSVSTTVIGSEGTATDALSTAIFVLGPEKGMELIENLDDFFAIIIYIDADSLAYRHNMEELSLEIINTGME